MSTSRSVRRRRSRCLPFALAAAFPAAALAAPPVFTLRPPGAEEAFVGSAYKAVVIAEGSPRPEISVEEPAGAHFLDDTLTYAVPPSLGVGAAFPVRIRASNADGSAIASWTVTVVAPVDLEFADPAELSALFVDPGIEDPSSKRGRVVASVLGGDLQILLPGTGPDDFDSWCGFDRTPRWWSARKVFGAFVVETRLWFPVPPSPIDDGYHAGLLLDRGYADLTILGGIRDRVEVERTCLADDDGTHEAPLFPRAWGDGSEVSLRIEVSGKRQVFQARQSDRDAWTTIREIEEARPPTLGVGVAAKIWGSQGDLVAAFRYFRYRGLDADPPVVTAPGDDAAFAEGPYTTPIDVRSALPVSLEVVSPAGATIGADGILRYQVTQAPGTTFGVEVRASNSLGSTIGSWQVSVLAPVRHEFASAGEFDASFFDSGSDTPSPLEGGIGISVAAGQLRISVPGTGAPGTGEDFDSWCGFDRTPRWLHAYRATGSFAAETVLSFPAPPPNLAEGYFVGLAVDRGHRRLAILGALLNGVSYGRGCDAAGDGAGALFLQGLLDDPARKVHLRAESDGTAHTYLARLSPSNPWVPIASFDRRRPRADGVGLAVKTWGSQGDFVAAFDSFEYGPPGARIVEAPADAEVTPGDRVSGRVRAAGVNVAYSFASAPAGASIDAATGAVLYTVPPGAAAATRLAFEARATAGLSQATVAWTLTVRSSEPPLDIADVSPPHAEPGETIVLTGSGFTPDTEVLLGGRVVASEDVEFVDSHTLRVRVRGIPTGTHDVVVRGTDPDGNVVEDALPGAFGSLSLWAPPPDVFETTLVDGRSPAFRWRSLVAYDQVLVYREGELLGSLPGDAGSFEDLALDIVRPTKYRVIAKTPQGVLVASDFHVAVPICDPPSDPGTADPGDRRFRLRGGHPVYQPGGGGGDSLEDGGSEGGSGAALDVAYAGQQFQPVVLDSAGALYQSIPAGDLLDLFGDHETVTGFTLLEEAKKLRIQIHGKKLADGPNLSLRVLARCVTPGVERAVELVVPDPCLHRLPRWSDLTYNTEEPSDDVRAASVPPHPSDPAKDSPFPAGDYLVRIYAAGGDDQVRHHEVSSDRSADQIFVPGVGCPPYPLVRVEDTTARNSNPVIVGIEQDPDSQTLAVPILPTLGLYLATLRATVDDPDGDPITKYTWRVRTATVSGSDSETCALGAGGSVQTKATAAPKVAFALPDYGYYTVELTAEDNRCGTSTRAFDVTIYPPPVCLGAGQGANVSYATPRPDQLHEIPDIPGNLTVAYPRSRHLRVLVADQCLAPGQPVTVPLTMKAMLALDDPRVAGLQDLPGTRVDIAPVKTTDAGQPLRFWETKVQGLSLGAVPRLDPDPGTYPPRFRVSLIARTSTKADADPSIDADWQPWQVVESYSPTKAIEPDSWRLHYYPRPAYMDLGTNYCILESVSSGGQYTFAVDMASPQQSGVDFEPSPKDKIRNRIRDVGQRARVHMRRGLWWMDPVEVRSSATLVNVDVTGSVEAGSGGSGGGGAETGTGGAAVDVFNYEHCEKRNIFKESFSSTIFEGVLYSGPLVGPIYATVTGSVWFGVAASLDAYSSLRLRGLDFGTPYEAVLRLCPSASFGVGAAGRADLFFGVASVEVGAVGTTSIKMPFELLSDTTGVHASYGLQMDASVDTYVEGCIFWGTVCKRHDKQVFHDTIATTGNVGISCASCPSGGGGGYGGGDGPGGAAGLPAGFDPVDHQLAIATSPSGTYQVLAGLFLANEEPGSRPVLRYLVRVVGDGWLYPFKTVAVVSPLNGLSRNPSILFVDETAVLLAWTQTYEDLEPGLAGLDPSSADYFNLAARRDEVVYSVGTLASNGINWTPLVSLSGDGAGPELRADGMVKVAKSPAEDVVWATWVRYETESIVVPLVPPLPNPLDPANPIAARANLRETSIYARKIVASPPSPGTFPDWQPSGPKVRVSGPGQEIDIEPSIDAASDGTFHLVWLNDPTHPDLITSNVGRRILHATNSGAGWSAPAPVLSSASALPGILEPEIAVKDPGYGMLVFTALPANAPETDVGLGNMRLVYTVKHLGGAWKEPPLLIQEKCNSPVLSGPSLSLFKPSLAYPVEPEFPQPPDFTLLLVKAGPLGTPEGGGVISTIHYDAKAGLWGSPVALTADGRVHENIAGAVTGGGEVIVVSESPVVAVPAAGGGGGGGAETGAEGAAAGSLVEDLLFQEMALVADPAVAVCRVADPHGAPGQATVVTVDVENRGFAPTPYDREGGSLLEVVGSFPDRHTGERRQLFRLPVPVLDPGATAVVEADVRHLEAPAPLRVELLGAPEGQLDSENDARVVHLGAPPPESVGCGLVEGSEARGVLVRWASPTAYDAVLIERDGQTVAELPGTYASYLDSVEEIVAAAGDPGSVHRYGVRGRLGSSTSVPATCEIDVSGGAGASFRRGDADGNGSLQITDAIALLGYLFLGGAAPGCPDSADGDDNGDLQITDAVRILGYLFLGGEAPPEPGPYRCGTDPTPDRLGLCEGACR